MSIFIGLALPAAFALPFQVMAQVAADMNPLAQFGLLGVVLGYFMYQGTKLAGEIRMLAHRIDGMTKALLMDMITREGVGQHAKSEAQQAIAKIQAREKE